MRSDIYDLTFELEDDHWWYVARRQVILETAMRWLPRTEVAPRLLDYGCGSGGNLAALAKLGDAYGLDGHPRAVELARSRGLRAELIDDAARRHPYGDDFDLVTLLDVLEHIEDDVGALRRLAGWLRPGGRLLLTVPAYPWLWSGEDEVSQHVRRYTRRSLGGCLEKAGLEVLRMSHFNLLLLGPQALVALGQRLGRRFADRRPESNVGPVPAPLNGLLRAVMTSEAPLLRRFDLPAGSSILCVAEP